MNGFNTAYKPPGAERSKSSNMLRILILFLACLSIAAAFLGCSSLAQFAPTNTPTDNPNVSGKHFSLTDAAKKSSEDKEALSVMEIAKKVVPAVVGIKTEVTTRDIFGYKYTTTGSGSGIIVSEDGYIATNNHVIANANKITVLLSSGEEYDATLIGSDPRTDLAVIKIQASDLTFAELGDSSTLEVGELAVAIGNPLGELAGTVTAGIISALNRSVEVDGKVINLLQTDAAINPGNSGGALVNSFGEVIAINTAKSSGVDIEGIGFAIPINDAKPIIEQLINHGYVTGRPSLGITARDITEELAWRYNMPQGVYIAEIIPNGAADIAGLKKGDIITAFNNTPVKSTNELTEKLESCTIGQTVNLTVVRQRKALSINVVLKEYVPS